MKYARLSAWGLLSRLIITEVIHAVMGGVTRCGILIVLTFVALPNIDGKCPVLRFRINTVLSILGEIRERGDDPNGKLFL